MKRLHVGIIGLGNMGSAHAKMIFGYEIPQMELSALCDIDPEKKKEMKET